MSLDLHLKDLRKQIDAEISQYLDSIKPKEEKRGLIELHKAMSYALTSGGGRWRPVLSCLVAEALNCPIKKVLPYALAVELVHSYSLVHDDLPAMDNDDYRRGQPATHKAFGESMAILAGDALCTEPYRVIAKAYASQPSLALKLITLLAETAGHEGMVGGQAVDISVKNDDLNLSDLEFLHQCKTVALFKAAALGAGMIAEASNEAILQLEKYSQALGLLFQLTDDLADGSQSEEPSVIKVLGLEKAKEYCQNIALQAKAQSLGAQLSDLAEYITKR